MWSLVIQTTQPGSSDTLEKLEISSDQVSPTTGRSGLSKIGLSGGCSMGIVNASVCMKNIMTDTNQCFCLSAVSRENRLTWMEAIALGRCMSYEM